jgi:dihydroflavonol-4-reductase
VVHTASPYILANITDEENQLIKPALEGTKLVLNACSEAGTVKRVVITSSVAAIAYPLNKDWPEDQTFDESWWTNLDAEGLHPYRKAKTLAERAAWDY